MLCHWVAAERRLTFDSLSGTCQVPRQGQHSSRARSYLSRKDPKGLSRNSPLTSAPLLGDWTDSSSSFPASRLVSVLDLESCTDPLFEALVISRECAKSNYGPHFHCVHRGKLICFQFLHPAARPPTGSVVADQSSQLTTAKTCLSTTKSLYDLQEKYQDAPLILVSMCSETNVISASLAHLRSLLLHRQHIGRSQPELLLLDVLDQALTGCNVVFGCLGLELRRIVPGSGEPGPASAAAAGWRARARLIWNEKRLNELLSALRGQQTAINLVIQLFQV